MVIVIGAVGSGKTTLLYSLMHETSLTKGSHDQSGSLAYVEQEPFIYSASVKDNITFGLSFDEKRFNYAIEVSQLKHDLAQFGRGADTVIGERGVNISGGQKARISLARAVYSNADIYLLDDPLSAVDPEVANAIFNDCISAASADGKIVILVTH